ncbi:Ribonuclease P protein subunit p29 [Aphelenchoides bicaudatus]|nr:Ribonuclease P protein subunit p29 [Aphelenchoides bicaudatus]
MDVPSTSQKKHVVHLDKVPRKRRGKPKATLLNVIRNAGGGKNAFNELKYKDLLDLYKLWCGYFQEIADMFKDKMDVRILKADYHGCLLRVTHATNPSQIGLYGIVAHESKHTFQLVTRQDRVIIIPKEGTTFQFVLNERVYTLFGDAMKQRSHLRGRKSKQRPTLPFFLK